jgi:hypothetical protein
MTSHLTLALSFALFLLGCSRREAGPFVSTDSTSTNQLALYLVAEEVPRNSIIDGTAKASGWQLQHPPILSDADFVSWDPLSHSFVVDPTAAKRLVGACLYRNAPFVLAAHGQPVYLGVFWTLTSSSSSRVPVILTDHILNDCFVDIANFSDNDWAGIRRGGPNLTGVLLAMTNAVTNVTLHIDRAINAADHLADRPDKRADPRIAIAVDARFRNARNSATK